MDKIKPFALPGALVLLALAVLLHGRYESHTAVNVLWVLDRVSGEVKYCAYADSISPQDICRKIPRPESWADLGKPARAMTDAEVGIKPQDKK